ncbi:MAG TPA: hypothetical protein VMF66_01670 [Candidatus Acidoferrum sp.]|nr:hypothetical protein [Candidatus Acidoferrum sp.]
MMTCLMFVFSVGALIQFAVSYCRTLLLNSSELEISKRVLEITGVATESYAPADFGRVMQLIRFAPQMQDDAAQMRAISVYYRLTRMASAVVSPLSGEASGWFERELSRCTQFAVVALDRRVATATAAR